VSDNATEITLGVGATENKDVNKDPRQRPRTRDVNVNCRKAKANNDHIYIFGEHLAKTNDSKSLSDISMSVKLCILSAYHQLHKRSVASRVKAEAKN